MSKLTRVKQLEKTGLPKRTVCCTISNGRAKCSPWYEGGPRHDNLTRPEFEKLKAELKAENVEVLELHIISVEPNGAERSSWGSDEA